MAFAQEQPMSADDPRRRLPDQSNDPFYRSRTGQKAQEKQGKVNPDFEDLTLFSGTANSELSQAKAKVGRFTDGEVNIQVHENVRGKDVYIIQPTCPPVNDNLMELFLMISTLRRASARKITAVIPYYGYARQDRKLSARVPISAADIARLLETMGVDRVIAVDLHCGQIQGFFGPRVPVDNLQAGVVGLEYFIQNKDLDLDSLVIVSPDAGGVYRARSFQENLINKGCKNVGLAMIIKQRSGASMIERMDLVGNVEGKDCVIVDDMIDTSAATELKAQGAKNVYAFATHGLFSGPAAERIRKSDLSQVVVTNTIPQTKEFKELTAGKVEHLSIGVLVAEAIRRVHQKESISDLFK